MHLSDQALTEFRAIWEEESRRDGAKRAGEVISDEALREMATRVLRVVDAIYHPIPLDDERR